ncbi:hypothetical protein TraAM80_10142 [Trypanosoma rangeli]|uniref:Uncharacterized protein n=1 Tax=Trypanosoma rangeli TaxID=5698 RepID=A0A3R7R3X8_TRYRA|nr:uncharacterized protein TraAM80_10142 [Trypanosoma rangeli]RNE95673.1 hypothetical protein TraAM80_10142 [Trypanosoma rangeli]|eukprot:RNE95673.1 hypothetical protein TraAM80_10142 [Trypanosoma rangeli]
MYKQYSSGSFRVTGGSIRICVCPPLVRAMPALRRRTPWQPHRQRQKDGDGLAARCAEAPAASRSVAVANQEGCPPTRGAAQHTRRHARVPTTSSIRTITYAHVPSSAEGREGRGTIRP